MDLGVSFCLVLVFRVHEHMPAAPERQMEPTAKEPGWWRTHSLRRSPIGYLVALLLAIVIRHFVLGKIGVPHMICLVAHG